MLESRKYKKHNLAKKFKAVELYNQGYGSTMISRDLSVSISQIERWINIFKAKGTKEFEKELKMYINYYNNERIKSKLNGQSPVKFRTQSYF